MRTRLIVLLKLLGLTAHARRFPSLSSTSLTYFFALLGTGLLFLILAFTLFLPVIMLAPSKFAVCFTIGSLLTLSAFMSLRGWGGQLAHMFSSERLPFTAGVCAAGAIHC